MGHEDGAEHVASVPVPYWTDDRGIRTYSSEQVEHPPHYTDHPSGVECITITEHMTFLRGNAMKYLWRAGSKGSELEDLKKARWYIDREIANLQEASRAGA